MSVKAVAWVLHESKSKGNDRMVLVVIADEADNDGRDSFPSVDRIARCANVHRTTVLRCLASLESQGELLVKRTAHRGPGSHNRYVVTMGRDPLAAAGEMGWEPPKLRLDLLAYWSQTATNSDNPRRLGITPVADGELVAGWSQNGPELVAPGATRPVDPIDTGVATQSASGKPRRRGLDPPPLSPADQQAAAARAIAERHDRERQEPVALASPAVAKAELAKARDNLRRGRAS